MADLLVAIPGDLDAPTGGYAYARRVLALLPAQGIAPEVVGLPSSFPAPTESDLAETERIFAGLPPHLPLLVDGLAFGALPPSTIAAAGDRPILALVHHPLGLEEGLAEDAARALLSSERAALALTRRIVVTSPYTARLLVDRLGVSAACIHVAPPGTERPLALRGRVPGRMRQVEGVASILAVGAVTPRKGYDVLVRALATLGDLAWRATIAGALDRAPAHVADLRNLIHESGLAERVVLTGSVPDDALEDLYRRADLVVSSSLFEGYGMVLAESLARGIPIVMARGGAADETVPDDAALKVAPGDVAGLAGALRAALTDGGLRERLAAASAEAGLALPRWRDAARIIAEAVAAARQGEKS